GPGEAVITVDTPWGRIGLTICYDLRFPDLYRALSNAGCTVLLVPAAFTVPTGNAHWHVLLRARAIEASAFVIAPAQVGLHDDGRSTYGHSLVVDPWGDVLLDMADQNGIACTDIDFALLEDVRARIPSLRHRRPLPEVKILS
ncbi:MAG: nitrilase-related carbon-nitrogen hydrolase, partial [Sphingobium sp.]